MMDIYELLVTGIMICGVAVLCYYLGLVVWDCAVWFVRTYILPPSITYIPLTNSAARLEYELDAYGHQLLCYHPKLVEQRVCIFAYFITNNYNIKIDILEAESLLRQRYVLLKENKI